jgi:hypothetical protein
MSDVSEHDPEEEGERNDRKQTGVDLSIAGTTISIDEFLECPCNLFMLYIKIDTSLVLMLEGGS